MAVTTAIGAALDAYQRWTLTTAVYPAEKCHEYLGLGLGDEAAELLEKALIIDAGINTGPSISAVAGLIDEGGDVMWYLAQALHHRDVLLSEVYHLAQTEDRRFLGTMLHAAGEVVVGCGMMQGREKKALRDGVFDEAKFLAAAVRVVQGVEAVARGVGNLRLIDVVHRNQSKLEARKDRGTLKGDGDVR